MTMPGDTDELDRLRAENARLAGERDAALTARDTALAAKVKLERKVSKLEQKVDELLRKITGRTSEKIDPAQLVLEFAADAAEVAAEIASEQLPTPPSVDETPDGEAPAPEPAATPRKDRKKGHGWKKAPKDLPRKRVEITPTDDELVCTCCGGRRTSIGAPEVTERLDYKPASLFVVETVRHRFRCPKCQDGTAIAPLSPPPIPEATRGRAEAGLLAQVVVSKYNDHLPLHRQHEIFRREGADLPRSTLCDWLAGTARLLAPIAAQVLRDILTRPVVGLDETGIRVVFDRKDPKNGTRSARIWAYRGSPGEAYFAISDTKEKKDPDGPIAVLAGYAGYVQADAAGAFDDLFADGRRIEVGCNAHARRKYFEARTSNPREAAYALATYRRVYEVEKRIRDASPGERLAARRRETRPLLAAFDAWIDELAESPALVPGTPLALAVGYSRNHRVALRRFLDDPQLSPDNNAVERALRGVAVGRKNWLFAGSRDAARDAAVFYTLVTSCREVGCDVWEYFHDVIERRAAEPDAPVAPLAPRAWWSARRTGRPAAKT